MIATALSRRKPPILHRLLSTSSDLYTKYSFVPPPTLHPTKPPTAPPPQQPKPPYRPPSSLTPDTPPLRSDAPFDFRFSYTESSSKVRPIGLREPRYSPFGPGRLDREWTGVCAPALDSKKSSAVAREMEEKRRVMRESVQGERLSDAERRALVESCEGGKTKSQINLGRDGLTHNILINIHNCWKNAEAVRIKCMGVPTVDMKNICTELEDKSFGQIIYRRGDLLMLYRGRHYKPQEMPKLPLMLWKPHEPVYPRLIKTTIDGLSVAETKKMRKRGLAVPALTKLAINGYYGRLVPMVRDAFLVDEFVRIDCKGLEKSDYRRIGCKLKDLVPCVLVTFEKEQIVIWRGKHYQPSVAGYFLNIKETFDDPKDDSSNTADQDEYTDETHGQ